MWRTNAKVDVLAFVLETFVEKNFRKTEYLNHVVEECFSLKFLIDRKIFKQVV